MESAGNIVYATTSSKSIHAFKRLRNNGGRRAIDCSLISIQQAAKEAGMDDCYFDAEFSVIRNRMVQLVRTLHDHTTISNLALYFLPEGDLPKSGEPLSDPAMERLCHCIRNESLCWEIIFLYERHYHPSQANLIICSETDSDIYTCMNPQRAIEPDLPFLFIGCSVARSHFEALIPVDAKHVIADLKYIDGWKETHRYELEQGEGAVITIHTVCNTDGSTMLHTELTGTRKYSKSNPLVKTLENIQPVRIELFRFNAEYATTRDDMDEFLLRSIQMGVLIETFRNFRL